MKFKIFLILVVLFLGCSNPSEPTINPFESFTYPLAVGNVWIYEQTRTLSNIVPDTLTLPYPHIQKGSVSIAVTDFDSTQIGIEVFKLQTAIYDSLTQNIDSAVLLFNNEIDGLYEYANTGTNIAIPISKPRLFDIIIKSESEKKIINQKSSSEMIQVPKQSIKYPVGLNSEWLFIDSTNNLFRIDKKITNYTFLETNIGRQFCFEVEWIYNPNLYASIKDYYSKLGLMKRTITYYNIRISDQFGTYLGTADITEEYNIVSFLNVNK